MGLATLPTNENKMFISAKNRLNLNLLETEIKKALFADWVVCKMFIPYSSGSILSYFNDKANILHMEHQEEGTMIEVELSPVDHKKYLDFIWIEEAN